jgi:hypothetical protein
MCVQCSATLCSNFRGMFYRSFAAKIVLKTLAHFYITIKLPYILESNPHSVFGDFLNRKKSLFVVLIHTFPSTTPCPQGYWLKNIGCYQCIKIRRHAWGRWVILVPRSEPLSTSVRNLIRSQLAPWLLKRGRCLFQFVVDCSYGRGTLEI